MRVLKRVLKRKLKRFLYKKGSFLLALVMLLPTLFVMTGCAVDNSAVNKAFASSVVMNSICGHLQDQADLIEELYRTGIITATLANNLNEQLNRLYKAASSLTSASTSSVPNFNNLYVDSTAVQSGAITVSADYNEFIGTVLQSMYEFGDGPPNIPHKNLTNLTNKVWAEENMAVGGSPIDMYGGFWTKGLIRETSYGPLAAYDKLNSKDVAIPLAPFGAAGSDTVTALVNHLNGLTDINVYYVNPNKVSDTKSLQGLKAAISEAKSDATKAPTLASNYFIDTGRKISFVNAKLTFDKIYPIKDIEVYEEDYTGLRKVAAYKIRLLDRQAILGYANETSSSGDLSSGVLIGNKFFITRYPVAVFRGFYRSSDDATKYIPAFTHPFFWSGKTYGDIDGDGVFKGDEAPLKGSLFKGTPDSYVDELVAGDVGTAETKCAYVDLYTGAMYYKGEVIGNTQPFMGVGTSDIESSIVIKPSTSVYVVKDNPACITTVPQPKKFKLWETLQIGERAANQVMLPGKDTNIMPVVFLMDYLELVYSPNTVGTDAFTAYGRKVRLDEKVILGTEFLSASPQPVAYIVGGEVSISEWATNKSMYSPLTMTDFMDIDGIYDENLAPKSKDAAGEVNKVTAAVRYIPSGTSNFDKAGTVRVGDAAEERSDKLPQIAAGVGIECVMRFGAQNLDAADSASMPKTPLYGITLYGGVYERGLFSNWINAPSNVNMQKWAKTLKDLGYPNYVISDAVLTEKMKGNYAFELTQDDMLAIDMDTVIQINRERVEERRGNGIIFLRTLLLALGFVFISYVSVLLGAWALDVNFDLGLNLLEKVSFRHFVAVRSLDEMPAPDPDSTTTYVDFRRLVMRCLAFASVGVALVVLDPVDLIVKLLTALNFLINVISEKIFGVSIM